MKSASSSPAFATTRNACNVCTPLGACLVFRGIEGAVPYLHGSQGCSTYIRRYLIGHFREPIDIASSNFSESSAIYGGEENFRVGLENVIRQYQPKLVGVATTCLSETIGEDLNLYLHAMRASLPADAPEIVHVSTPSYQGTHAEGFHAAVRSVVASIAQSGPTERLVDLFPGMVSPADLRHLRSICTDFDLTPICLPDYADTLDGPIWEDYQRVPPGGTPLELIRRMGRALGSIDFAATYPEDRRGATDLAQRCDVPRHRLPLPMGIGSTDRVFAALQQLSNRPIPEPHTAERGRLIDAFVDGHKYVSGKRVILIGDEDLLVGLASLVCEIGMRPVLCASGSDSGRLRAALERDVEHLPDDVAVLQDTDFKTIEEAATDLAPDLFIGSSKTYALSRKLDVPLVRVGFPIHDRIGAARRLHVGYRGTQDLFDRIVNTLIGFAQDRNGVGYMNM